MAYMRKESEHFAPGVNERKRPRRSRPVESSFSHQAPSLLGAAVIWETKTR